MPSRTQTTIFSDEEKSLTLGDINTLHPDQHPSQKRSPSLRRFGQTLRSSFEAFRPSFADSKSSSSAPAVKKKSLPTAFLTGLKGVAALVVFTKHFATEWYPALFHSYGAKPEHVFFFQLPIIRIFHSGTGAVSLFFVISGYVLTAKPLRQLHSGDKQAVLETMASTILRRPVGMYLPLFASMFGYMLASYLGLFPVFSKKGIPGMPVDLHGVPSKFATFQEHVWNWSRDVSRLIVAYEEFDYTVPHLHPHMWTVPIEFRGSIFILATILGLSMIRETCRAFALALFCTCAFRIGSWEMGLFLGGALMAQIDITWKKEMSSPSWMASRILSPLLFAFSIFLLCSNNLFTEEVGSGYEWMKAFTPAVYHHAKGFSRLWTSIGAILVIFSISLSENTTSGPEPMWRPRRILESAWAQYMGKISFALFLLHGVIIYTLGDRMRLAAWGAYAREVGDDKVVETILHAQMVYFSMFAFTYTMCLTFGLWFADLFHHSIILRAVKIGRDLEVWMLARDTAPPVKVF